MMQRSHLPQELGMICRQKVQLKRTKPGGSLTRAPLCSPASAPPLGHTAPAFSAPLPPWLGLTSALGSCRRFSLLHHGTNHPTLDVLPDIWAFYSVTGRSA